MKFQVVISQRLINKLCWPGFALIELRMHNMHMVMFSPSFRHVKDLSCLELLVILKGSLPIISRPSENLIINYATLCIIVGSL